jgi:hypothetical protein
MHFEQCFSVEIFRTPKPWAVAVVNNISPLVACEDCIAAVSTILAAFHRHELLDATQSTLLGYPLYCLSCLTTFYQPLLQTASAGSTSIDRVFIRIWNYDLSNGEPLSADINYTMKPHD